MTRSDHHIIAVSPEMTTLLAPVNPADVPPSTASVVLAFRLKRDGVQSVVHILSGPFPGQAAAAVAEADAVLVVLRSALDRLFHWTPDSVDGVRFHLSHQLSAIALDLVKDGRGDESLIAYRLAKSIELLCETVAALDADALVPASGDGAHTERDTRAIIAARQMVDSQWTQKLTLDAIARACGINRAKLTKGFRDLFGQTISEALAERRLVEARAKLLTTDLPVSSIGYASGYLNNASFTRAFGRRFGQSPSDFRAMRLAA